MGEIPERTEAGWLWSIDRIAALEAENAELKRIASEHRDGRLAALEKIAALEAENAELRKPTPLLYNDAWLESQGVIAKLQAFKSWVHAYLDDKGIPTHFDTHGPCENCKTPQAMCVGIDNGCCGDCRHVKKNNHSAEGCRIGDRMDLVFFRITELEAKKEAAESYRRGLEFRIETLERLCAAEKEWREGGHTRNFGLKGDRVPGMCCDNRKVFGGGSHTERWKNHMRLWDELQAALKAVGK